MTSGGLVCPTDFERLIYQEFPDVGLNAFVCIHSTVLGPALGGIRIYPYETWEDARTDALRLGGGMTYKMATVHPMYQNGGGKAVIIANPEEAEKDPDRLRKFATEFLELLAGKYIGGEDSGLTVRGVEIMAEAISGVVKFIVGRSEENGGAGNPADYTQKGVVAGQRAAMQKIFKTRRFEGKTIVFQGVGEVGFRHARAVAQLGAKVIVCDTNGRMAERAVHELGARVVDPEKIFSVHGDIFAPSAMGGVLNDETIPKLADAGFKIVAGCANNQLADPDRHGKMLMDHGILYVPDYMINAGGAIAVADEMIGFNPTRAIQNINKIYDRVWEAISASEEKQIPPHVLADEFCEKKLALQKQVNELKLS